MLQENVQFEFEVRNMSTSNQRSGFRIYHEAVTSADYHYSSRDSAFDENDDNYYSDLEEDPSRTSSIIKRLSSRPVSKVPETQPKRSRRFIIAAIGCVSITAVIITVAAILGYYHHHAAGNQAMILDHNDATKEPWTKLMVVGGFPESVHGDVEVIDLSSSTSHYCEKPANFPGGSYASIGTYIDDHPMVCGGTFYPQVVRTCFSYSKEGNAWKSSAPLEENRGWSAGIMMNESAWWVTGGSQSVYSTGGVKSTEIYSAKVGWSSFKDMPKVEHEHCILKVNDTHYFLVGGIEQGKRAYLFNMRTMAWRRLPDSALTRVLPTCGVINRDSGEKEVVLAGGSYNSTYYSSTEIFSLASMTWRQGPDLPVGMDNALGIPYGSTFLAVGGFRKIGSNLGKIYDTTLRYDQRNDSWVEMEQHLENARGVYAAFLVPDEAVNC